MEETRKTARKPRTKSATPKAPAKPAAKPAKVAATAKAAARKATAKATAKAVPTPVEREEMVRTAAYFRAQQRGFAPGNEWEDWLVAEAEVGSLVEQAPAAKPRKAPARKSAKA